ncbi:hypothetical protein [Legionella waltersii]|uniref:Uncharacterized protein n=1 Tax=Legionella waltersii TaxID=66969 RepID=A0A0W0ZZX9_9GAMM|nr:hypothetical protein [Legionella waltersii]KTD74653.1 hypothetical protein Lwal_2694 [Legionella waltersii]SNV09047.1 Uncharacterised protein [Legionella waltersii]
MSQNQLKRKLRWIATITLCMMPFYSSNAVPINTSDSTKRITIQVSTENQKIKPCAYSDYAICTIELNQMDAPYGVLTITNSGG